MNFRSGLPYGAARVSLFTALLLGAVESAWGADFDGLFYGNNDYGDVGLLQTPSARTRPDGEFGVSVSTVRPYNQLQIYWQALPWLESTFRYTDITNRFYSNDPAFSGSQHYKDKSADLKVRLLTEGEYRPSIALGIQDIGGTGLFSSEYLVSNYHYYDLDFSLGLAWGRLGSGGGIPNPFRAFGNHFSQDRYSAVQSSVGVGGTVGYNYWFTGKTIGAFGGVKWKTPVKGLSVIIEYDGNNYEHEGLSENLRQDSPINLGLSYQGIRGVDFGVGFERGNTVMGRVSIYTNFQKLRGVAKTADPAPQPVPAATPVATATATGAPPQVVDQQAPPAAAAPAAPVSSSAPAAGPGADSSPAVQAGSSANSCRRVPTSTHSWPSKTEQDAYVLKLKAALKSQGGTMIAVDFDEYSKELRVWLRQDRYRNPAKAVGRFARVLSATAPAPIVKFTLVFVDQGVENYRAVLNRNDFNAAARGEKYFDNAASLVQMAAPGDGYSKAQFFDDTRFPDFSWDMGPAVRQSVGGPNGFYYGQLYWKVGAAVALTDHLNFTGVAGFNIINNFNDITLQSNSQLPHVRSDIVQYLQQGKNGLINLEADYVWSPAPDLYHRVSAGIFEEMYGGVATELLYRPYGRSWALAFDINRVKKRGFDEQFDFLPYTVTTGHATLYYKPGYYNLLFKLSGGQYLAHDRGGTIDISREFDDGVRVGIFATKTNVSAAQFGEGSFDKGAYISLPLDLFFAKSTRREAGFTFRPLTRDGGQMVYDGPELYFSVKDGQPADFERGQAELLK